MGIGAEVEVCEMGVEDGGEETMGVEVRAVGVGVGLESGALGTGLDETLREKAGATMAGFEEGAAEGAGDGVETGGFDLMKAVLMALEEVLRMEVGGLVRAGLEGEEARGLGTAREPAEGGGEARAVLDGEERVLEAAEAAERDAEEGERFGVTAEGTGAGVGAALWGFETVEAEARLPDEGERFGVVEGEVW